jgi:predicted Zn-dependent peptidase
MNRSIVLSGSSIATAVFLVANLPAQEAGHARGLAPGRGDVHSKGWDGAWKLRGAPLPPRFPEIGKDVRRIPLENGAILYVKEDRRLPLVEFEALVRVGDRYESAEEYGLAGMLGTMMRLGGTEKWEPQALDDRLAFLAANLSVGIGEDSGSVSLGLLSKDLAEGLEIFTEVLRRPRFDERRLELARRRAMNAILQRNDNPGQILRRELDALFYPADHPRGRSQTPQQLAGITRERLRDFYARHFRPENTRIAIVGDFDEGEMVERVRAALAGWERGGEPLGPPAKFEPEERPGIFVVRRDLNQSSISLAQPAIDRSNPDRYAVTMMNSILGGGSFSSRITESVRSNEGLAYSARSAFPTDDREPGLFQATVQTKTETTTRAVDILEEEIRRMKAGPISKNEFDTAKESILYGMVFRNDRPSQVVSRLMRLEFEGLPADQDRIDFEGFSAVTPEHVVAAARKYLRPEDLTIFVVGDTEGFEAEAASRGAITRIEPKDYDLASFEEAGFRPGR